MTATKEAYLPRSLLSSLLVPDERSARAQALTIGLRLASSAAGALGVGVRAALHCWSVQLRRAQPLPCGRWYVESCPSYLTTVDGCTSWAARLAWSAARRLVGWLEASTDHARTCGAQLREKAPGTRFGRHLLLEPWQVASIAAVCGTTSTPNAVAVDGAEALARFSRGARTATVHCPNHDDKTPSMVVWANGGAQCMACQLPDGSSPRWAWIGRGKTLHLLPAGKQVAPTFVARRNNKGPPVTCATPFGPVGGMVARGAVHSFPVSSRLGCVLTDGAWRTHRSAGSRTGCVLAALQRAEQRSATPQAADRARVALVCGEGLPARAVLPDALLSASTMGRDTGRHGWSAPWQPRCQAWVLLDLDNVAQLDGCHDVGSVLAGVAAADSQLSGRCAVVRTSPTGVQVWAELALARHSAATWHQLPAVRAWHAALGSSLLAALHGLGAAGGAADASACAAGRFGRRPGWRIKAGALYRAHLLHVSA